MTQFIQSDNDITIVHSSGALRLPRGEGHLRPENLEIAFSDPEQNSGMIRVNTTFQSQEMLDHGVDPQHVLEVNLNGEWIQLGTEPRTSSFVLRSGDIITGDLEVLGSLTTSDLAYDGNLIVDNLVVEGNVVFDGSGMTGPYTLLANIAAEFTQEVQFNTRVLVPNGYANEPSIAFINDIDQDTGIYSPSENKLGFITEGQSRFIIGNETTEIATDVIVDSRGYLKIPDGNTNQRPNPPLPGMMRYNYETSSVEMFIGTSWVNISSQSDTGTYVRRTGDTVTGPITMLGQDANFYAIDGESHLPGIAFESAQSTGFWKSANHDLNISIDGFHAVNMNDTVASVYLDLDIQGENSTFTNLAFIVNANEEIHNVDQLFVYGTPTSNYDIDVATFNVTSNLHSIDTTSLEINADNFFSSSNVYNITGNAFNINTAFTNVANSHILINAGETGAGISNGNAYVVFDRGIEPNAYIGYDEGTEQFVMGTSNPSIVASVTMNPESDGVALWNDSEKIIDTHPGLIFDRLGNQLLVTGRVGINATDPSYSLVIDSTDAIKLPTGTTDDRPSPEEGIIRYNNDTDCLEVYIGGAHEDWLSIGYGPESSIITSDGGEVEGDLLFAENSRILLDDGNGASPSLTFTANDTSGLFLDNDTGNIVITINSSDMLRLDPNLSLMASSFEIQGSFTVGAEGNASSPTISFSADGATGTGIYSDGSIVGFSVDESNILVLNENQTTILTQVDVNGSITVNNSDGFSSEVSALSLILNVGEESEFGTAGISVMLDDGTSQRLYYDENLSNWFIGNESDPGIVASVHESLGITPQESGPVYWHAGHQKLSVDPNVLLSRVEFSTGNIFELSSTDGNKYKRINSEDPVNIVIAENSIIPFIVGTEIRFEQSGTGALTFSPDANVTLNIRSGLLPTTNGQFSVVTIKKVEVNTWTIFGDLAS